MFKTHYEKHRYGNSEAQRQWEKEGLIPDKVKFCDALMMVKGRELYFTRNTDEVDCKKCQKKIDSWTRNKIDLPNFVSLQPKTEINTLILQIMIK